MSKELHDLDLFFITGVTKIAVPWTYSQFAYSQHSISPGWLAANENSSGQDCPPRCPQTRRNSEPREILGRRRKGLEAIRRSSTPLMSMGTGAGLGWAGVQETLTTVSPVQPGAAQLLCLTRRRYQVPLVPRASVLLSSYS